MSYEWGMTDLPTGDFDGQVMVDAYNVLWQWDGTNQVWRRADELRLEELRSFTLYLAGYSPPGTGYWDRKRNSEKNTWDVAFDKAFISVEAVDDPSTVYGRIAHVSRAEFETWFNTAFPWPDNVRVRVLQAVDPRRKPNRMTGWNNMYGALRGRHAYRKNKGRGDLGLPQSAGIDPKSAMTFACTPAPEIQLVQLFVGQTPATGETRAIWFPRRRENLTLLPKNNDARINPSYFDRFCWNDLTQTWGAITSDQWSTADANASNPACFWTDPNNGGAMLVDMINGPMKGADFITERRVVCVVYHLVDLADGHNHAFYVKPLGITSMAADVQVSPSDWSLIAASRYVGDGSTMRFAAVSVQDRTPNDGWRWWLHDCVPPFANGRSGRNNWTLSTQTVPNEMHFYIRNNTTGVVSPYFPGSVEIARRRYNMAMGFLEKRG